MTTGIRKPSEFCWINMLTPQPEAARDFFAEVLGWSYAEIPGMGHSIRVGGRDVGGLFDLAGPGTPPGTPPTIGVMIKVASADETCAKVAALGGRAQPAFDIMDQGRMAVCFDPTGAEFDVWEPKKGPGMEVDSRLHGAPSWFEAVTTDVDRARDFYTGLFGWTADTFPMPDGTYTTFRLDGPPVAGMLAITPQMGPVPPFWATYFTIDDADQAAARATALGATQCVPFHDIEGIGRFCGLTSPQGVMFYVIRYAGSSA